MIDSTEIQSVLWITTRGLNALKKPCLVTIVTAHALDLYDGLDRYCQFDWWGANSSDRDRYENYRSWGDLFSAQARHQIDSIVTPGQEDQADIELSNDLAASQAARQT